MGTRFRARSTVGVSPMIVVIPDGNSRYGCGQWVDSPMTGNFEQYVVKDVVAFVDAHHRTVPDLRSRGVFGFSSGGFGAWNLASQIGRASCRERGVIAVGGGGAN